MLPGSALSTLTKRFGQSVAMDGANMMGGSIEGSGEPPFWYRRCAEILTCDDSIWTQHYGFAAGWIVYDLNVQYFPSNVAIDGDWAMMGAPQLGDQYVRVAYCQESVWTPKGQLIPSDGSPGNRFGNAVAISGDVTVVGSRDDNIGEEQNAGSAYIFRRSGSPPNEQWDQEQKITASSPGFRDYFGADVAVEGDVAVVGAPGHPGTTGEVYVFRYDSG